MKEEKIWVQMLNNRSTEFEWKEGEIGCIDAHVNSHGVPMVAIVLYERMVYAYLYEFKIIPWPKTD